LSESAATKSTTGRFFEDFRLGETIRHAAPRTVTTGDVALYHGLFGPRFAVQSSDAFAQAIGYPRSPLDDLLVFHLVFGMTVADISLNAVANLGYADCRFLKAIYPGDTLNAVSEVIGLRENSNRKTGIVYVRSRGFDQEGAVVLDYVRWVMVRKRDGAAPAPSESVPALPDAVEPARLGAACPKFDAAAYDFALAGSKHCFGDYRAGEKIDHIDGITVEEAEHMMATRLYHNTARVHFNQFNESKGRFGRRLIYGGHAISLARALSFNGLANAFRVAAINGGRHVAPLFAGDTVFAWSEVLADADLPGRPDVGALRLRTIATKDRPCPDFPLMDGDGYDPAVILDLDYWVLVPRRGAIPRTRRCAKRSGVVRRRSGVRFRAEVSWVPGPHRDIACCDALGTQTKITHSLLNGRPTAAHKAAAPPRRARRWSVRAKPKGRSAARRQWR
jgi:2-methylfumaryl-CoA hydratase